MADAPKIPKIIYGTGPTTLSLTLPMTQIVSDRDTVGGRSESGAGIPENYILLKRSYVTATLRFYETELPSVVAWLDWVMDNGSQGFFDFYPDKGSATKASCYLTKPLPGNRYGVVRDPEMSMVLNLPIELRTVNNALFNVVL